MYKLHQPVLISLPFLALLFWLGTLLGLLIGWCRAGRPHYPSMPLGAKIPFVVDDSFLFISVRAVLMSTRYISGSRFIKKSHSWLMLSQILELQVYSLYLLQDAVPLVYALAYLSPLGGC
jgi:hypothetical protein